MLPPNQKGPRPATFAADGVMFRDAKLTDSDLSNPIKTDQDDLSTVSTCRSPSASMLMPKDANSALRSFSAFTPSALGTCRRKLENQGEHGRTIESLALHNCMDLIGNAWDVH